jgi:B-box zinc finger
MSGLGGLIGSAAHHSGHQTVMCPFHQNKEIIYFCRTHSTPLCENCQHEHCFDAASNMPMIAGGHYPITNGGHDIVRIEKFLSDTVAHMHAQLQSFNVFIQHKKTPAFM